ncbi:MAG: phage head closure protein [Rikenellaceae bacterium]
MFDTRIEILRYHEVRDEYNERSNVPVSEGIYFAQRTENGGRENLYASRIVHENEVVYTIRYTPSVTAGMLVREDGIDRKIISTHPEGRRYRLHIKCLKVDAED